MVRPVATTLVAALLLGVPGPACWGQVGRVVRTAPAAPGVPVSVPAAPGLSAPSLSAPLGPALASPVLPVPSAPSAASAAPSPAAAAARPVRALAAPLIKEAAVAPAATVAGAPEASPKSQAASAGRLGRLAGAVFDGARSLFGANAVSGEEKPAAPLLKAPADLKLSAADDEAVSQFTADFHAKVAGLWPDYQFTVRDYYAWARYLRFFTPIAGVKEALRAGAAYVYGDRLESEAERAAFDRELASAMGALRLAAPEHGKDAALAKKLVALAEPAPETYADDEESPFKVPLAKLVPSKEGTALVLTPTTLRRIEAAWRAFAMRDFALLLGPPATEKSAIPKYLAAENGIPYLAVTMHPGIGTFELVGGYRPKVARITDLADAKRIVNARLKAAEESGDWSEFLESAARVYKGGLEEVAAAARKDLEAESKESSRRLKTLAHGLEYGAASLVWQDGYLTYALKRDIWISFEEINAAPTESQEFLNDFMRTRRLVITQKLGEPQVLEPQAGGRFMLWATMNPETDPNREVLSQTLKNRWRVKYFGDLPAFEQAEIIEKKYGLPTTWALALVENFHKELRRQARDRVIGDAWRDGYEINLRHLMKVAKRWKHFVAAETEAGRAPDQKRQLHLLAREAYSVYGGLMRAANERAGVFVLLDQALKLASAGIRSPADLTVRPDRIEDLGDRVRIGDVELPQGRGGAFVPRPNSDYLDDPGVYQRLYEYAKALALGEPLLVMGDSAAGKTSDLEYLFFRLNRNLRYKNLDTDSAIEEVIGGYATGRRRGQYVFQEGLLPAAMEEGSGAFLDEFNLNPLVEWLNTVIDDGRLYLPERIVEGRPLLVAAANPPDPRYPGRILLSPATRSRYTELWVDKDDSAGRLKRLMGHWLKGGTAYALMLLPAVGSLLSGAGLGALGRSAVPASVTPVPGHSRGEFDPGVNWGMALLVVATAGFFIGAAAGGVSGIIGLPMLLAPMVALVLMSRHSARKAAMPLAPANARYLNARVDGLFGSRRPLLRKAAGPSVSERRAALGQLLNGLSSADAEAISFLADLAVAETSESNLLDIVKGIGQAGGPHAVAALEGLRGRLKPEHLSFIDLALIAARDAEAAEAKAQEELAAMTAPAPSPDLRSRAEAALSRLGSSLPDQLRAAALREALAADLADPVAARRLEALLAEKPAAGLGALGAKVSDALKRFFGLKKKSEASEDEPAGPPSLEEVFKARNIPEAEQPALRAKVARVETLMRMVGGSVGRDSSLEWAPGDLWAYFPETNTATYPVEHLVTHSEEELVGVIDHEALHRETTVMDQRLALVRKYVEDPIKHFLWNGLEDPRVNSRGIHRLPGAERYLHALYDRYLPRDIAGFKDAKVEAPDLAELGDGATAFDPKVLQFPHVEFVMAANYWWRHGAKPSFVNKSAEEAFDKALPDLREIFAMYPKDAEPGPDQSRSFTMEALRRIDEKVLHLYQPLVVESQKKLAKQMKGRKKGGQGKGQRGGGQGMPDPNAKEQKEAMRRLEDHARRAAEALRGQMKEAPSKKDVEKAREAAVDAAREKGAGAQVGDAEAKPLTIEEIAATQREQILNRQATPYQNAYQPVAHLANPMVTHLENVFLKNSRPRDVGWYKTGKRPDMKRAMKREGEGGVRDDVMLRRTAASKRRYKVTLLVDESGSMDAFRREAIQTVVLFVDALSRLQIDVEVIGFADKARIHKKFSEPLTQAAKDRLIAELQEHLGSGSTHDADALKLAVERIVQEDADERYVFVVTDGQGNGPSKLASVFPLAEKARVKVMGVGVGEGMAYVRTAYPRHAVVDDIAKLPRTLRDKLVENIARVEAAARGAAQRFLPGAGAPAGSNALGKSLPRFFAPTALLAAAWSWGVMLAVPALSALAPAFLQPLPAALMFASLLVFVPMKRWLPDAGGIGFITVIGGLIAGVGLPTYAYVLVAPLLGLFFAADRGASLAGILARARPIGGKDTALLAFFAAAAYFPLYSYLLALAPLLAQPFIAAAVVAALLVLWRRTRAEEPLLLAYLSGGAFVLTFLGGWPVGAVIGTVLGFKGLYGAFGSRQARAALAEEALSAAQARAEEAARAAAELGKVTEAARVPPSDLRARARAVRDAQGEDLAGRLRRAALDEALAAYEVDPSPVNARRLQALLEEGAPNGANALGRAGVLRWAALPLLAGYIALQFALPAWGAPAAVALAVHLAASAGWMALAWRWRDGSPLPLMLVMNGFLPVMSSFHLLSWPALIPWWTSLFAVSGTALALLIDRYKRRLLPLRLACAVWKAGPLSYWPNPFLGRAEERWAALKRLRADVSLYQGNAEPERLFPMVELLADHDPYKELRSEAVGVLAAYLPRASARAALERVAKPKRHPGTAWEASTALINEKLAAAEAALEAQRRAEQERKAMADVAARAEAALAAVDASTLAGRLRRAALEEALSAYRADANEVNARRLRGLLEEGKASGSAALGRTLDRLLWRPWILVSAIALGFHSAIFAVVLAFPQAFIPLGGVFAIAFFFFLFAGKGRYSAYLTFGSLSAAMAVSGVKMMVWQVPYAVVGLLYLMIAMQLAPKLRGRFGLLEAEVERKVRRAGRGLSLDAVQAGWAEDLSLRRPRRLAALSAMRRDPARARALEPVLRELWSDDDGRTSSALVDVVAGWGDAGALATLDWMASWTYTKSGEATPGARAAKAAAEALRAALAEAAEVERLAQAAEEARRRAEAQPHEALIKEARAALAGLGEGLAERLRRAAIAEAVAELERAADPAAAAVAARRLRERLDALRSPGEGMGAAGKTSLWTLPAGFRAPPGRFPAPLSRRLKALLMWDAPEVVLMQSSWILGLAASFFIGWDAVFVFAGPFLAGMAWHTVKTLWPRKADWHVGPTEELQAQAYAVWQGLPEAARTRLERVLRPLRPRSNGQLTYLKPWPVRVDHPFLYLVHPYATARRAAYAAAEGELERQAAALAPLLAAGVKARELATTVSKGGDFKNVPEDYGLLLRLGAPGAEALAGLSSVPDEVRAALEAEKAAAELAELAPKGDPSDRSREALAEARRRVAQPAEGLPAELARRSLKDAAAALEAAPRDGVALRRLEELLRAAPGKANGIRSRLPDFSAPAGAIRALTLGAVLPAALAVLLSAGAALAALWALAPAAAAAAGGLGAALGYRVLAKPVPVSSRELFHAPRAFDSVPEEFRPVVEALGRLSARLGGPMPGAALYKPEDAALEHGGWNALALGPRLAEESAVAVGEAWVRAAPAELEGALAHELGHLALGDNRRVEAFRRTARLALWSLPLGAVAALWSGLWLIPAGAAVLWTLALLSGAGLQRALERRADLFAAWLAGPAATKAFLGRLASEAPSGGGGLLSTHPSPAARLALLPARFR